MTTTATATIADLCTCTPTVQVMDNRGLTVRTLLFNRTLSTTPADLRISQYRYHARGQLQNSLDPRLFDQRQVDSSVVPNFRYQRSLSGQPLRTQSVDAGELVVLYDVAGGVNWQLNSRGRLTRYAYDALHRPVTVVEQVGSAAERISERLSYGDQPPVRDGANTRGQLLRHYDTAGLHEVPAYALTGHPLLSVRQVLRDAQAQSDWQGDETAWQAQLDAERYTSRVRYNALGGAIGSVDAKGHQQRQSLNIAGQLASSGLTLLGETDERALLTAIRYSAAGQVLQETAGNGVTSDYSYEAPTQRLSRLLTTRPPLNGRSTVLQDLSYRYDPVGNILAISDTAQAVHYHKNQCIVAVNDYQYDALYQLTQASGRENVGATAQGLRLPVPQVPISEDPNAFSTYTRSYTYDRGDNLTQIRHQGAQAHTTEFLVAPGSNRALQQTGSLSPGAVEGYFDACGNLRQLAPGQPLAWNGRNQLQRVAQVPRPNGDDDAETYQYDGSGQRLRKTTVSHTSGTVRTAQVLYLPGLELRLTQSDSAGITNTVEALQVINAGTAGRQSMRLLHWETGQPADISNDQLRGSLGNQIGSSLLELDQQADILTLEEYYPYGGTAVWSGKTLGETQYKFVRYSGKERDMTGLYYYGFRYYAPWLGRWLNPDPAGTVDGLNLFRMVRNNPIGYIDVLGMAPKPAAAYRGRDDSTEKQLLAELGNPSVIARGVSELSKDRQEAFFHAVNYATDVLNIAIHQLKIAKPGGRVEMDLHFYLGTGEGYFTHQMDFAELRRVLEAQYTVLRDSIDSLSGARRNQILFTDSEMGVASVELTDPHKRMHITRLFLDSGYPPYKKARALIHETSHQELTTEDFFYHGVSQKEDITHYSSIENIGIVATDAVKSRDGLSLETLCHKENFITASRQNEISSALNQFHNDKLLRAELMLRNADSIAFLAPVLAGSDLALLSSRGIYKRSLSAPQ